MFLQSFKITGLAVAQIFLLAAIGYFLVKKGVLGHEGINSLTALVIKITLPILIFYQLVKDFRFNIYPDWWIFPLLSIFITILGLAVGALFIGFIRGTQQRLQFLSLITFQNSGYLPLALVSSLLPNDKVNAMFIYLFLFLLGFNLVIWSMGVYMLTFTPLETKGRQERDAVSLTGFTRTKRFELGSIFSPPVIAAIFSLIFIFLGLHKFVPDALLKPLGMIGDCTLPLAMFVVGGNLGQIHLIHIDKKAIFFMTLAKLIILPLLGLWLAMQFKFPEMLGLLMVMQLAMPPATSLSIITRHYKKEDLLISQGIFFGHIISIITIPIFLGLYFALVMIK